MALRFGYTLMRVCPDGRNTDYETLATEEFPVETDDELRCRKYALRAWSEDHLTAINPELALFYAVYSTLDEDDNPGFPFGTEHIAWEGHAEIPTTTTRRPVRLL